MEVWENVQLIIDNPDAILRFFSGVISVYGFNPGKQSFLPALDAGVRSPAGRGNGESNLSQSLAFEFLSSVTGFRVLLPRTSPGKPCPGLRHHGCRSRQRPYPEPMRQA